MPDTKEETLIALGLLGATGVGLVVLALTHKAPAGAGPPGSHYDDLGSTYPIAPLAAGEQMGMITCVSFDASPPVTSVAIGRPVVAMRPQVTYSGPGRNAYTYFRILQNQGGVWVTVYGSGIAGSYLAPAGQLAQYDLVPAQQPEPCGFPSQSLGAFIWPGYDCNGAIPTPICGAPPRAGSAVVAIEIYEKKYAVDEDGYASPTCHLLSSARRAPVARRLWKNFSFVAV